MVILFWMYIGEVIFNVTAGTLNLGLHVISLSMKSSQTIRDIKEKIARDENIPLEKLSIWCIDYENGKDDFVIDEEKTLKHYIEKETNISNIYLKESGFEPRVEKLGISDFCKKLINL